MAKGDRKKVRKEFSDQEKLANSPLDLNGRRKDRKSEPMSSQGWTENLREVPKILTTIQPKTRVIALVALLVGLLFIPSMSYIPEAQRFWAFAILVAFSIVVVCVCSWMERGISERSMTASFHKPKNNAMVLDDTHRRKLPAGWTLCFIGQLQGDILKTVFDTLRKPPSDSGDGKEFSSGLAYWGIIPTWNWLDACRDQQYPVMAKGRKNLELVIAKLSDELDKPFHYVSLGVGDGQVDSKLIGKLLAKHSDRVLCNHTKQTRGLYYFPVDFSPEMLRVGIEGIHPFANPETLEIIPIQIDFSEAEYVHQLRQMVDHFVTSEPVLFGLVGNTLANFQQDLKLLKNLSELLHPDDLFLLEIAFTEEISEAAADRAAEEYSKSKAFTNFLNSALLQNTDLSLDQGKVHFRGSVESENALFIKMFFKNESDKDLQFRLPKGELVEFPRNDTIRLLISRKYSKQGINEIVRQAGFQILWQEFKTYKQEGSFGSGILLLRKKESG